MFKPHKIFITFVFLFLLFIMILFFVRRSVDDSVNKGKTPWADKHNIQKKIQEKKGRIGI